MPIPRFYKARNFSYCLLTMRLKGVECAGFPRPGSYRENMFYRSDSQPALFSVNDKLR
jgi:hypothetical protein